VNPPFDFDQDAALSTILYIASNVPDVGFHKIAKVLYFADREHVARYGRFICGDAYVAMKNGPVPSAIYDILKTARQQPDRLHESGAFRVEERGHNKPVVVPLQAPDLGELSLSDLECLDESIRKHGHQTFDELTELSHDDAWRSADENDFIPLEGFVASLGLEDADALLEYIKNPHP